MKLDQVGFYQKFEKLKVEATLDNYKLDVGKFQKFFEENVLIAKDLAEDLAKPGNKYVVINHLLSPQKNPIDSRVTHIPGFDRLERARQIIQNYAEGADIALSNYTEKDIELYQAINNCLDVVKHVKLYAKLSDDHRNGRDMNV